MQAITLVDVNNIKQFSEISFETTPYFFLKSNNYNIILTFIKNHKYYKKKKKLN